MSDTPETQAKQFLILSSLQSGTEMVVRAEHCAQMEKERDAARAELAAANARIAEQAREIADLKTVMVAAAEEIAKHWQAHCDAEGYGPSNLLRRLEEGLTGGGYYGYTSGAFSDLRCALDRSLVRAVAAEAALEKVRQEKDGAYLERNKVVAALAKCFPAGRARTAIEGWSADWHGCVYIDLPTGQVSWHYHDSQAALFDFLPKYAGKWDGHTTEQKYERVAALQSALRKER